MGKKGGKPRGERTHQDKWDQADPEDQAGKGKGLSKKEAKKAAKIALKKGIPRRRKDSGSEEEDDDDDHEEEEEEEEEKGEEEEGEEGEEGEKRRVVKELEALAVDGPSEASAVVGRKEEGEQEEQEQEQEEQEEEEEESDHEETAAGETMNLKKKNQRATRIFKVTAAAAAASVREICSLREEKGGERGILKELT